MLQYIVKKPQYIVKSQRLTGKYGTETTILQTQNVLGKDLPEKFYVINGDTTYVEVDGKSVRDYFGRKKVRE